jgi:uncharacterized membrane protein (UPF0127 family)
MIRSGFALLLGLLWACQQAGGESPRAADAGKRPPTVQPDVTAEYFAMPALPRGRVRLVDAFGGQHVVEVEVAHTTAARTRGLMWRRDLREGAGMLFLFAEERPLTFWMRNTLIPLDMVFLSHGLQIVGIVEHAEPRTLDARGPSRAAQYVLEVPGGWAAKVGLRAGLVARFEGTAGLVPEP